MTEEPNNSSPISTEHCPARLTAQALHPEGAPVLAPETGLIWMQGECVFFEPPKNRHMRFRRTFSIPSEPANATCKIWADTRYILWINGSYVARGPGRSDPRLSRYDVLDVGPYLTKGKNTLAVHVLHQGFGTGDRISIMQGLLLQLDAETINEETVQIVSDESWKTSPLPQLLRPTPRLHATLGCIEVHDLRLQEEGWQNGDFDDSKWKPSAYIKSDLTVSPFYRFVPREIPLLNEEKWSTGSICMEGHGTLQKPDDLEQLGNTRPFPHFDSKEPQPLPHTILPSNSHGEARVITLDFGDNIAGLLRFDAEGAEGTVIDVLYAEFLVDGVVPRPEGPPRMQQDRFILRAGRQLAEVALNARAFRYAQLWVWSENPVTLHKAWVDTINYPRSQVPSFQCDDPDLVKIDAISEATLRLCMKDGYVDSFSREQQQWIGDGRKQAVFNHYRFGDAHLHRQLIEQIGQGQDWNGTVCPRFPAGNRNVNPIPSYCLDWVCAFDEYYQFTGDGSLLREWWPNITMALRWFTSFEQDDGLLCNVPYWNYIDLADSLRTGQQMGTGSILTALNLKYLEAVQNAVVMAGQIKDVEAQRFYQHKADRLTRAIQTMLWDPQRNVYADARTGDHLCETFSEVTNALALLHLEAPQSPRANQLIEQVFSIGTEALPSSPLHMWEVLNALGEHRETARALNLIRERYREHLEQGFTTTWEHWGLKSRDETGYPRCHSASHAWGAAPMAFFTSTVLGIRPTSPGWKTVSIHPQPGDLQQASGSVMTPLGMLSVEWSCEEDEFRLSAVVPEGIEGTATLPDGSTHLLKGTSTAFSNCRRNFGCHIREALWSGIGDVASNAVVPRRF